MNRRTLLKLLAAAAAAGCSRRDGSGPKLRVVVAGAGIIGASIAYHLAKAGAAVTVVDAQGPASHASGGTFAWINATWAKQPRHYHALNQDGVAGWHTLQETLQLPLRWGGSLEWFPPGERQQELRQQIEEQADWGEPARMLDARELAALEPHVDFNGVESAAFSGNDGAVDPVVATQALLNAARRLGAVVRHPCELQDVRLTAGRVTAAETSLGTIACDRIVLATGAAPAVPAMLAGIEVPQRSTPGIIATTMPLPRLLNSVIAAPGCHLHQRDDGCVVIGEQAGAPQNDAHAARLAGRPNAFPDGPIAAQHAARMLAAASQFVPPLSQAAIGSVRIGWRPLPLDGHPVLGASPVRRDVYIAITHSGVTLAPVIGELAAFELVEDATVERLGPYRPDRVFEVIRRY